MIAPVLVFLIIVSIAAAWLAVDLAGRRGRSRYAWGLAAFLFAPAVFVLMLLPERRSRL